MLCWSHAHTQLDALAWQFHLHACKGCKCSHTHHPPQLLVTCLLSTPCPEVPMSTHAAQLLHPWFWYTSCSQGSCVHRHGPSHVPTGPCKCPAQRCPCPPMQPRPCIPSLVHVLPRRHVHPRCPGPVLCQATQAPLVTSQLPTRAWHVTLHMLEHDHNLIAVEGGPQNSVSNSSCQPNPGPVSLCLPPMTCPVCQLRP